MRYRRTSPHHCSTPLVRGERRGKGRWCWYRRRRRRGGGTATKGGKVVGGRRPRGGEGARVSCRK
jgi:hypothetical protein